MTEFIKVNAFAFDLATNRTNIGAEMWISINSIAMIEPSTTLINGDPKVTSTITLKEQINRAVWQSPEEIFEMIEHVLYRDITDGR